MSVLCDEKDPSKRHSRAFPELVKLEEHWEFEFKRKFIASERAIGAHRQRQRQLSVSKSRFALDPCVEYIREGVEWEQASELQSWVPVWSRVQSRASV